MKTWIGVLSLLACVSILAIANPHVRPSTTALTENDFRRLEQVWLDAASVPDLSVLQKLFSDDFMGTSFGGGVLSKNDVVPPPGVSANHFPKCTLQNSTVRIFGDTAVLMGDVKMEVPKKPEDVRMTTVFKKRSEEWEIIAVHISKASD